MWDLVLGGMLCIKSRELVENMRGITQVIEKTVLWLLKTRIAQGDRRPGKPAQKEYELFQYLEYVANN